MNTKARGIATPAMRRALIDTVPVLIGYLFLGIGFGVILYEAGYGLPWALGMSVFIYSGSMQYLAVDLLASGASLVTAALTTLMVNARHLFYGISVIDLYRPLKKSKPYMLFALTDENYSIICGRSAPRDVDRYSYYFFVTLFNHSYWIVGSALGSLLGSLIPFNTEGIDFALTALFVTIFVDQWRAAKSHLPVITGFAASLICLVIFGGDKFLIPSMILITLALTVENRRELWGKGKEGEHDADTNA
ncbi:MAG: AzlC family ABC transporter permease [Clostridia bacterium]|nr:AzlC family ABC transporter permease [Clostridia bacterium]